MSKVVDFLENAKVFYIATVDGDTPKVRPFGLVFEFEGKIYFGVGDHKPSYQQLNANPRFEISTFDGKEWIRLSAKAVFDRRTEVLEAAFAKAPNLRELYSAEEGPQLATFYAAEATAVFADLDGKNEVIEL